MAVSVTITFLINNSIRKEKFSFSERKSRKTCFFLLRHIDSLCDRHLLFLFSPNKSNRKTTLIVMRLNLFVLNQCYSTKKISSSIIISDRIYSKFINNSIRWTRTCSREFYRSIFVHEIKLLWRKWSQLADWSSSTILK